MSKFAIISALGDGLSMAHRLSGEGNEVSLFNFEKQADEVGIGFNGFKRYSASTTDIARYVALNKDAIFIFDGSEKGGYQDRLRKLGMKVIGSSSLGSRIEKDRMFGVNLAKELGVRTPETIEVENVQKAIDYIKKNPAKYILKQTGDLPKTLNFKANFNDSRDIILHLLTMQMKLGDKLDGKLVLQEYIEGLEVAVCGLYAGDDWLKMNGEILLEVNYENKKLLEGDRGISTGELGTVVKFITGENRIFTEMVKPLEEKLKEVNHFGMVDANCIYDGKDLYLLEWTVRFGYPVTDLYIELCNTNYGDFLSSWANKEEVSFNTDDYGVVLALGFPLFPYEKSNSKEDSYLGEVVYLDGLTSDEQDKLHLYEVNYTAIKGYGKQYTIGETFGFFGTVTSSDKDYAKANENCIKMIEKIIPSKQGFYRRDIAEVCKKRIEGTKKINSTGQN